MAGTMCGIAGWVSGKSGSVRTLAAVARALREIRPRGPNMEGAAVWSPGGDILTNPDLEKNGDYPIVMGLAHTRLSIIDLSEAGRQPFLCENGSWIVYNGEIYNFQELRQELSALGHKFTTRTDTEVIGAAYREWGRGCVSRFNGMWAFALYDPDERVLFCSRDRLGVKPFYWARDEAGGFAFASTPAATLLLAEREPAIDPAHLGRYLIARVNDDLEDGLYRHVKMLRGGRNGIWNQDSGEWREEEYWRLPEEPDLELDDAAALDRFEELLEDAVTLRFRSDVPVALTLSGGVDSSAIAIAASRVGAHPLAYTSHFPDFADIDESGFAKQAADAGKLEHILVKPDFSDLIEGEGLWTKAQGLPFGSLSGYVHWSIMREIRSRGTIVVLSGQGGDELFWGYESYVPYFVFEKLPNPVSALGRWWVSARRIRQPWHLTPLYYAAYRMPVLLDKYRAGRIRDIFADEIVSGGLALLNKENRDKKMDRRQWQSRELLSRSLPTLLRQDDRTTGAMGMETRLPFLDYRMVEFAHRLPWLHSIRDGWTKYLTRRYLERHGLPELAWRTHKLGFNAPQADWQARLWKEHGERLMREPFANFLLNSRVMEQAGALSGRKQWDVYHLLRMAELCGWIS